MPELLKKILTWVGFGFLIFFVAFRPDAAAEVFRGIGAGLMAIFQGFGDFFTGLTS